MVFVSDRPEGKGMSDLYVSKFNNDVWTIAKNLGSKINSPSREERPTFSPDGKYLFFGSEKEGQFDIYQVDAGVLEIN